MLFVVSMFVFFFVIASFSVSLLIKKSASLEADFK